MSRSNYEFLNGNRMAEFHLLKLYPASALNRDDAGEQKTAYYNGTLRNRISSQCLKRAYRLSDNFKDAFAEIGTRTLRMPEIVGERLVKEGIPQNDANQIKLILAGADLEKVGTNNYKPVQGEKDLKEGKPVRSPALAFYSEEELSSITSICKAVYDSLPEPKRKSLVKGFKKADIETQMRKLVHPMTVDVAAYGRMVTDNMLRPVEGAMQVAHALSTNAAIKESDYFIACDDFVNGDTAEDKGAGMLSDIDYDSACYYIHAIADLEQFAENLQNSDDMEELVKSLPAKFADIMAYTDPSARQNSFESHVLPEVLFVELKEKKRPLNRMKAFATPCNKDVLKSSVNALAENIETVAKKADLGVTHAVWYCEDEGKDFKVPEGVTVAHSIMELEQILNDWMNV